MLLLALQNSPLTSFRPTQKYQKWQNVLLPFPKQLMTQRFGHYHAFTWAWTWFPLSCMKVNQKLYTTLKTTQSTFWSCVSFITIERTCCVVIHLGITCTGVILHNRTIKMGAVIALEFILLSLFVILMKVRHNHTWRWTKNNTIYCICLRLTR